MSSRSNVTTSPSPVVPTKRLSSISIQGSSAMPGVGERGHRILPPAPVARLRSRRVAVGQREGGGGSGTKISPPAYLPPPSPEKNGPRAGEGASRRGSSGAGGGLGDPHRRQVIPSVRHSHPPPRLRPGSQGLAAVRRKGGGGGGTIIMILPKETRLSSLTIDPTRLTMKVSRAHHQDHRQTPSSIL